MAKRTCISATTSLTLAFEPYWILEGYAAPLMTAFADAQLSNLKCLMFSTKQEPGQALVGFSDWLLPQAPRLEMLMLNARTQHLPAGHITFQHMRHLVMRSSSFKTSFIVAEQLPALETLSIHGGCLDTERMVVDVSGCKRLKRLVLYEFVAQELIWDASGTGPCPLAFVAEGTYPVISEGSSPALKRQAALTQQLKLRDGWCRYGSRVDGTFGWFPAMRLLALEWPPQMKTYCADSFDEDVFRGGVSSLLIQCMPGDGQPLLYLETILITAHSMRGTFPDASHFPNLKELVIRASGRLELEFQDPLDTIPRLGSMHVFGRPLVPQGLDKGMLKAALGALNKRGLVLGAEQ